MKLRILNAIGQAQHHLAISTLLAAALLDRVLEPLRLAYAWGHLAYLVSRPSRPSK